MAEMAEFQNQAINGLPQAPPDEAMLTHTCALRYLGQGFEVDVPLKSDDTPESLAQRFHATHQHEYGFALPRAPIEWVDLRAAWEIAPPAWQFPLSAVSGEQAETITIWERGPQSEAPVQRKAQLWQRSALSLDTILDGPAIIIEEDTTIYTPSGWQAQVVDGGYLRITRLNQSEMR